MSNMSNEGKAEGIGESWTERISGLFTNQLAMRGMTAGAEGIKLKKSMVRGMQRPGKRNL